MGATLLASEERERGDIDFEGTLDSDVQEQGHVFVAMPRGLQRSVEAPGFGKRTYGVLAYESSLEHTGRKCSKLDEQLDVLRAVIPNSARGIPFLRRERNESVIMDAYRYIATLQKQVEDLRAEVLECEEVCEERTLSHHSASDQQPMVEVTKRDGVMEVRIVCANRPGLLVDVMEAVESRGLTVTHTRIACHSDIVFKYLSRENEEYSATILLSTEWGSEEADAEEAELDSVKAMLVHAICEGRIDSDLQ